MALFQNIIKAGLGRRLIVFVMLITFLLTNVMVSVNAQGVGVLPVPGAMVGLSTTFTPPLLMGIKVYPKDPFRFDFILDKGDTNTTDAKLKTDSDRLIKYFLASLTVPEKDLWVNLSPYEKDRIVAKAFGQTEMGRDLLAQDYILKQITASVIYPEGVVGKQFWNKVYAEAKKRFGTTYISVDTFNKVWIVPKTATIYEHEYAAFVVESRLKVMLETDYLATSQSALPSSEGLNVEATHGDHGMPSEISKQVLREIVIPILEKEVNEGENFSQLRQVYNSLILATWFKRKVKSSLLGQSYVDKQKTLGIDITDKGESEKIWQRYVAAFKKGVYDLIREEHDPITQEIVPRKYFSGGARMDMAQAFGISKDASMLTNRRSDRDVLIQAGVEVMAPYGAGQEMALATEKDKSYLSDHLYYKGQAIPWSDLKLDLKGRALFYNGLKAEAIFGNANNVIFRFTEGLLSDLVFRVDKKNRDQDMNIIARRCARGAADKITPEFMNAGFLQDENGKGRGVVVMQYITPVSGGNNVEALAWLKGALSSDERDAVMRLFKRMVELGVYLEDFEVLSNIVVTRALNGQLIAYVVDPDNLYYSEESGASQADTLHDYLELLDIIEASEEDDVELTRMLRQYIEEKLGIVHEVRMSEVMPVLSSQEADWTGYLRSHEETFYKIDDDSGSDYAQALNPGAIDFDAMFESLPTDEEIQAVVDDGIRSEISAVTESLKKNLSEIKEKIVRGEIDLHKHAVVAGIFDPIHWGHMNLWLEFVNKFNMPVLILPAGNVKGYKENKSPASDRHEWLKAAIKPLAPFLQYSSAGLDNSDSWAVALGLQHLLSEPDRSGAEVLMLCGSDALERQVSFVEETLTQLGIKGHPPIRFIVGERKGFPLSQVAPTFQVTGKDDEFVYGSVQGAKEPFPVTVMDDPQHAISATRVRGEGNTKIFVPRAALRAMDKQDEATLTGGIDLDPAQEAGNRLAGEYRRVLSPLTQISWNQLTSEARRLLELVPLDDLHKLAKKEGKHADYLFSHGFEKLIRSLSDEEVVKYWPIILEAGLKTEGFAAYLYRYGFPVVQKYVHDFESAKEAFFSVASIVRSFQDWSVNVFKYSFPQLDTLMPDLQGLKMVSQDIGLMHDALGEGSGYVFIDGFIKLRQVFDDKELKQYWPGLVSMTVASKGDQKWFADHLDAVKQYFGIELEKDWDGIEAIALATGGKFSYFFSRPQELRSILDAIDREAVLGKLKFLVQYAFYGNKTNKAGYERVMQSDIDTLRSIKEQLQDIAKAVSASNALREGEVLVDQKKFEKEYLPLVYLLDSLLPGTLKYVMTMIEKNGGTETVVRFLNGKRLSLVNDEVMLALSDFLSRHIALKRSSRLHTAQVYKILDVSSAFLEIGQSVSLLQVIKYLPVEKDLQGAITILEASFLETMAQYFDVSWSDISLKVREKIYLPYMSRVPLALSHIQSTRKEKLSLFRLMLSAMLEDRFQDLIENEEQSAPEGRALAKHNGRIRKSLSDLGINVARWLGWEKDKRLPDRLFKVGDRAFQMRMIRREPGRDIFMGDFTDCCLGMSSGKSPHAIMERLTDEAINIIEVIDKKTNKPMAATWLFINEKGDLVIHNMEISANYRSPEELKSAVGEKMIEYALEFAEHIKVPRMWIGMPTHGEFFGSGGLIKTRYKDYLVKFGLKKIGGHFGNEYYLDTEGTPEAYLVWERDKLGKEDSAASLDQVDPAQGNEGLQAESAEDYYDFDKKKEDLGKLEAVVREIMSDIKGNAVPIIVGGSRYFGNGRKDVDIVLEGADERQQDLWLRFTQALATRLGRVSGVKIKICKDTPGPLFGAIPIETMDMDLESRSGERVRITLDILLNLRAYDPVLSRIKTLLLSDEQNILTMPLSDLLKLYFMVEYYIGERDKYVSMRKHYENGDVSSLAMPLRRRAVELRELLTQISDEEIISRIKERLRESVNDWDVVDPSRFDQAQVNGGIDLDPSQIDLKTEASGQAITFDIDQTMFQKMLEAQGLRPVIINMSPLESLPQFLGI